MIRRPHRLPDEAYVGRRVVSFTACERDRRPLLANPAVFKMVGECLAEGCRRHLCTVPVYVVMPDHLHAMVLGSEDASDSRRAMIEFKRLSGIAMRHRFEARWQEGFHDAVVWRGQWGTKARYIAQNPYRAGLVSPDEVWPYTGAVGHDLQEVLLDAFW